MSAEMMADVSDSYRTFRKAMEEKFNILFSGQNLLAQFDKWAFIAIIRDVDDPAFNEIVRKKWKM